MKVTNEMIAKLKAAAEELKYEYTNFGIRIQEQPFTPGEISHVSHIWIDGEDTGEKLNGICAISPSASEDYYIEYFGEHAAIVAGDLDSYGEDLFEVVLKDAVVIEVLA